MILNVKPTVDYAFKYAFGRETTRPVLANLLDEVLSPGRHVGAVDLLNPFNPKEALDDKLSVLDVKARDDSGRQFNVEMQMLAHRHYDKRILYYLAKLHQQQLREGNDYLELRPTISISFLNHVMFPEVPDYHLVFQLRELTHAFPFSLDLEVHVLELPKFTKSATELLPGLDPWLYFLRHAETMDTEAIPLALQTPMILRAVEEMKMLGLTDEDRNRYEARRMAELDYNTGMKVARMEGRDEGRKEGRDEGRKEGRDEGRKEGRDEGRKEGRDEGQLAGSAIGVIQLCERMLHRPQTPTEQLAQRPLDELTRLADKLQATLIAQDSARTGPA